MLASPLLRNAGDSAVIESRAYVGVLSIISLVSIASPAAALESFGARDAFANATLAIGNDASVHAVAVQRDGAIVVAAAADGDFKLVRYLGDGRPDRSFGRRGVASVDVAGFDAAYDVVVQPDGAIVTAGQAGGEGERAFALTRHLADGELDASFGDGGIVAIGFGFDAHATALALQADGRIIAAGCARIPLDVDARGNVRHDYVVARYRSNGELDAEFGADGVAVLDAGDRGGCDHVALALQTDGRIVIAAGFMPQDVADADMMVARFDADGSLDGGFNAGGDRPGMVTADFGGDDRAYAVLVQADGRIVVAGETRGGGSASAALARYLPDGALDVGFGDAGGLIPVGIEGYECSGARALAQLPDARIAFAGTVQARCADDGARRFLLYALTPEGLEDSGSIADADRGDEVAYALAVQPDRRVLLAGLAGAGTSAKVAVVRFVCGDPMGEPWNLLPYDANFINVNSAPRDSLLNTEFIAVQGFDRNLIVPVRVLNGEYALNGSSQYTTGPGWVQLGDEIGVRHVTSRELQGVVTTRVVVGGIQPVNNLALVLGPSAELSFTSTASAAGAGAAGGGGALDAIALAMLLVAVLAIGARRGQEDHGIECAGALRH